MNHKQKRPLRIKILSHPVTKQIKSLIRALKKFIISGLLSYFILQKSLVEAGVQTLKNTQALYIFS